MNWATLLYDRFIHDTPSKKTIVVDHTGLFSRKEFTESLAERNTSFAIVYSTTALFQLISKPVDMIIANQSSNRFSLPGAIQGSGRMIHVDFDALPFNIDVPLYESLEIDRLLLLLNYCTDFPHVFIHSANVDTILEQALKHHIGHQNQALKSLMETFIGTHGKATPDEVLEAGYCWGQYVFNCCKISYSPNLLLLKKMDEALINFILDGGLKHLPFKMLSQFKSVERICGYLKSVSSKKKALICFDGMGWAKWCLLKSALTRHMKLETIEKPVFSILPSTTQISRAAIYSGGNLSGIYHAPQFNEHKAFVNQFQDACMFKHRQPITNDSLLGYNVVSKIYNIFDDTAHSTQLQQNHLSKATYFDIVTRYLHQTPIFSELQTLLDNGFRVFFCSDHGCTIAAGMGKKIEAFLIDAYSKRGTLVIDKAALPEDKYIKYEIPIPGKPIVILAPPGKMYDYQNTCELTHGGAGLEEMIVPFIEIKTPGETC
ncbi:MAG: PglZ domain-containing protein [Thermodesulfobacteriota bacterium]|nr:PglZ domain-containing protein [Thermodesulfobacteriota bacterium]